MRNLSRHALYWIVIYFLWVYLKSYADVHQADFVIGLVYLSVFMMLYYFLTEIQIPYLYHRGKTTLFVLSLLGSSLFFISYWTAMMYSLSDWLSESDNLARMSIGGYCLETLQFYSPTVALLAWESFREQKKEKERIEILEKEKMANELKFLKAQLNPHFLFNTLHSLHERVIKKSTAAPEMILGLSNILDYILYKSQSKKVALREELNAIQHFLNLEQIRFGDQLQVIYEKQENSSLSISPLTLFSLVEYACKLLPYSETKPSKIAMKVKTIERSIRCELSHTKPEKDPSFEPTENPALELIAIRRQLQLSYPAQHELLVEDTDKEIKLLLYLNSSS